MTSRRLLLKVRAEDGCPLYEPGDQLVLHLPGVVTQASSAVCALTVAAFLREQDASQCPKVHRGNWPETFRCPRAERPVLFTVEPVEEEPAPPPPDRFTTADLPNAISQLRRIPVFRALSDGFLATVARNLETQRFSPGSVLVEKGHPGQGFFILVEGEVEIVGYAAEKMKSVVNVLEAPACFGEISLLTGSLTAASVTARTEVTVFVLSAADFHCMLRQHSEMAQRFTRLLATRVESANSLIVQAGNQGFRGKLSVMNVATVLQVLSEARQSGQLCVSADRDQATIGYNDGRVFSARFGELQGAEAVFALLSWEHGDFWLETGLVPERDEVHMGVTGLLLEGMRRIDEGES